MRPAGVLYNFRYDGDGKGLFDSFFVGGDYFAGLIPFKVTEIRYDTKEKDAAYVIGVCDGGGGIMIRQRNINQVIYNESGNLYTSEDSSGGISGIYTSDEQPDFAEREV